MKRPNPAQWLWYAVGGRLPANLAPWVLHDVTAKTWALRHAARGCVVLAPIAAGCLLVPGPLGLKLAMILLVAIVGVYFSLSYVDESCELRAAKHGYAHGIARATRESRNADRDAEERARYAANFRTPNP
ncbi:DUF5313 family protein [Actinophytocola oryzae]|uniref:DUF5313 domain-containing protein n=1 Tax=Actinophytocola oryzae TaxID=502181 RepID=A0A4R7V5V5_9PSEU|nr:DUF5313 family protein [Actinophytocola oryzae]TDV44853.1 hypothetical protein CLV71_113112 [Actinophytocola oryzae]